MDLSSYKTSPKIFDELLTQRNRARHGLGALARFLKKSSLKNLNARRLDAELAIRTMGITFTIYNEGENIDREWPFYIIPRTIMKSEWQRVALG